MRFVGLSRSRKPVVTSPVQDLDGLFLAFFGGVIVASVAVTMVRALATRSWTRTLGNVVDNRIVETQTSDELGGVEWRYQPQVWYEYSVGGETFTSTRIYVGENDVVGFRYSRHAAKRLSRYPPGSPVTVYYDPHRPSRAVLEPGIDRRLWLLLAAGGLVLAVGLAPLWRPGIFSF